MYGTFASQGHAVDRCLASLSGSFSGARTLRHLSPFVLERRDVLKGRGSNLPGLSDHLLPTRGVNGKGIIMFDLNLGAAGLRRAPALPETGPLPLNATPSARFVVAGEWIPSHALRSTRFYYKLSLIHISEPRDATLSRMPSSA